MVTTILIRKLSLLLVLITHKFVTASSSALDNFYYDLDIMQRLIFNQMISVYTLDDTFVTNERCRKHSQQIKTDIKSMVPYAMRMIDASSKVDSGIFNGNIALLGSPSECINTKQAIDGDIIRGKMCTVKGIIPSEIMERMLVTRINEGGYEKIKNALSIATFQWNLCIPDSCYSSDVKLHVDNIILPFLQGFNISSIIDEANCYTEMEEEPFSASEKAFITIVAMFVIATLLATYLDDHHNSSKENQSNFVYIFSLKQNMKYIINNEKDIYGLDCLRGIKSLSIFYVVSGHRLMVNMLYPTANGVEIAEWLRTLPASAAMGATVTVDTFFTLSGTLVAFLILNYSESTKKFNLLGIYLVRYMRLTALYLVVIVICATFFQRLGSGPLWTETVESVQLPCQVYWWSALLYLQNYINPDAICLVQTWYLSCDTIYYMFAPFIIYCLWKWPKIGILNIIGVYIISVIIPFVISWNNNLDPNQFVSMDLFGTDYFTKFYIAPHTRAAPYIMGLLFGYILHKTKNQTIVMSKMVVAGGWLYTIIMLPTIILSLHYFQTDDYQYNRLGASLYLALHRSLWSSGIIWLIWACKTGYGGIANTFLSSLALKAFGKISYSIYLIHVIIQFASSGSLKTPSYFSSNVLIRDTLADLCLSTVFGLFLTLFIESPIVRAGKVYLLRDQMMPKKMCSEKQI